MDGVNNIYSSAQSSCAKARIKSRARAERKEQIAGEVNYILLTAICVERHTHTVHSESIDTPRHFPHVVTLQPYSKMDLKKISSIYTQ